MLELDTLKIEVPVAKTLRGKTWHSKFEKGQTPHRSIWVNNGSRIRRCPVFKVVGNRRHSSKYRLKFLEIIGRNIRRHRCDVTWSILFWTARLSGVLYKVVENAYRPISRLKWYASRFRKGILRKWVWLCLIWVCELFWFAQIHLVLREA